VSPTTLWRDARLPGAERPRSILVADGRIAWIGPTGEAEPAGRVSIVDLGGAPVTPAFVDAHVHATSTGIALAGLDLAGCASLAEALVRLARHAAGQPEGTIVGSGWDETAWPEGRPLMAADLDGAAPGRHVYLARVDHHSAAVSTPVLAATPQARADRGFDPSGLLRMAAHERVRTAVHESMPTAQRRAAQRRTRARAAELGIGCLHELAGPVLSSEEDLAGVLALAREEPGPEVIGYWGELGGVDTALRHGCAGAAGDLFLDGSIGSHTAALCAPYVDRAESAGALYHDVAAVTRHVVACARAGLQAGFHVIGDAAVGAAVEAFEAAAEVVGADLIRAGRHRLEHVEMVDVDLGKRLAHLGVVASVQPAFDALWGGDSGMYARRLGAGRALAMNPFATLASCGVELAFGSDSPVTPLDPWGAVRAAVHHHTPAERLPLAAAIEAHTRAGWRAGRVDDSGVLEPGRAATFAVWDDTGGLLAGDPAAAAPTCLRTVVRGETIYEG
jgi:predicted amidohydrolase YtcJ